MIRLPDAERRTLAPEKVTAYLLAAETPGGAPKAKFFRAFGFSREEWPVLVKALLAHPLDNEVLRVEASAYGPKYHVVCRLRTPDGRDPCVTTIWQAVDGGSPRSITALPRGT